MTKLSLSYIILGEALVALIHVVHIAVGHPVPGQTDPKVQEDDRIELTVVHKLTKLLTHFLILLYDGFVLFTVKESLFPRSHRQI